jgi:hypothetical protein
MTTTEVTYEAIPMQQPPDGSRALILSEILRKACKVETAFTGAEAACDADCLEKDVAEMCPACLGRMQRVSAALLKPDAVVWEVWRENADGTACVGIIRFSEVRAGEDAKAHYVFFDGNLRGKTEVMKSVIAWAFGEREGWLPLRRLSIEIPDYAFALARHASRKLGFSGPFRWKLPKGGLALQVEGVKRGAVTWRGQRHDLLMLGLVNPQV